MGLAAAVVLLGAWFVIVSGQRKQEFAGRELDQARNVAESGNLPLAASQLQKVISTYAGTPAAEEAILTLNQVRIVNGQQELAASGLQEFVKSSPSSEYLAPAYALLGEALENAKRPGKRRRLSFPRASTPPWTTFAPNTWWMPAVPGPAPESAIKRSRPTGRSLPSIPRPNPRSKLRCGSPS